MTEEHQLKAATLAAHSRGILAYLSGTMQEPPPADDAGTVVAALRAGWMSARAALRP